MKVFNFFLGFVFLLMSVTTMQAQFDPSYKGYYRLKSMGGGDAVSLESNNGATGTAKNGAAFMDKTQNVSGQLWKFEKVK